MVWGFAKKLIGGVLNKDEFEATVSAGILMAGANGTIEPKEINELKDGLEDRENMAPFKDQVHATIIEYKDRLSTNRGRVFLRQQILDIAGKEESVREAVFGTALDVAGQLDDAEIRQAHEIAEWLNLSPSKFKVPPLPQG